MEPTIAGLFLLPLFISVILLIAPKNLAKSIVTFSALILSALSVYTWLTLDQTIWISLPPIANKVVAAIDIALLVFFGFIAIRQKSLLIGIFSLLQLALLVYLVSAAPHTAAPQLMIDKLSTFMFLLINIISGIIAIFALQYMEDEPCSLFRKKYFLSVIFWFIAVMNLLVCSDNLEYFFLFFELTTLASFLLIRFRKDDVSEKNAITALWMNQAGGLAILVAILYLVQNGFAEASFSNLLAQGKAGGILLPLALISMAALIKGAQMPFSKWLLGAMVAPTPVSALLHSSTMVKIAPFVILKLSPALKDTPVASVIIGLTAFVFLAAAIGALAQDNLKRILAHSTIALLALMMMMAALGTPVTTMAALLLMLFHGISKSMLFLNAGVLERVFHLKETSNMDRLAESGPFTAMVIIIGFMSLLLPPFGAFIGKWMSIETLGSYATEARLAGAFTLLAVAGGGAVLTLLYFKVTGLMINRTGEKDRVDFEKTGTIFRGTMYALLTLVACGIFGLPLLLTSLFAPAAADILQVPVTVAYSGWNIVAGNMSLPVIPLLIAFLLLPATIVAAMFVRFKNVDRAGEYMCGEKINYSFGSFYFSTDAAMPYFYGTGILFFIGLIVVSLL